MCKYVFKEKQAYEYAFIQFIMAFWDIVPQVVNIVFPGLIITELITDRQIERLVIYLCVLLLTPIIDKIIRRFFNVRLTYIYKTLGNKFLKDYDYRSAMMDYETFENPEIQDTMDRLYRTFYNALSVIDRLYSMLSAIFGLGVIFTIIANLNAFIVVVVLLVIFLNSRITKRQNVKNYETNKAMTQYNRYINSSLILTLHSKWTAKETRLFNLKDYFAEMLFNNRCKADKISLNYTRTGLNAGVFYALTNFFQSLLIYAYLVYLVLFKSLPIGMMTIYMSAIGQFASAFSGIVNSYLNMAEKCFEVYELMEFMETPMKQYETGNIIPVFNQNSIFEFKNVSFKYPSSDVYALKNFNLKLYGNEKLCIVGNNGSGKTTFIKLLTRLYFPTEGEILLNGLNINEYDYEQYQALFSSVFQDYWLYELSLRENIVLSNTKDDDNYLSKVINNSGLADLVNKLPKKLDTSVYKSFDEEGFEPSGGEAQRIAIARALYRNSPIYILDEPTAALDPNTEHEIYTQFNNMIKDKTAVLITHRLSAVQLADKIAVFNDGQVAEYGTHSELYSKGGIYTEMFNKQAQFYKDNPI